MSNFRWDNHILFMRFELMANGTAIWLNPSQIACILVEEDATYSDIRCVNGERHIVRGNAIQQIEELVGGCIGTPPSTK